MPDVSIAVSIPCPTCSGCARSAWSESPAPPWAALAGTARVEWADGSPPGLPLGTSDPFRRSESLPLLGEERVVRIRGPFRTEGRVPFQALFAPALAALNGLVEHPDLMRHSAMTACTPLAVLAQGDGYAWLRVRVEEVTELVGAAHRFPPSTAGSLEDLLPPPGIKVTSSQATSGGLRYYDWSIQSDIGRWAVCTDDEHGTAILLHGEWSSHQDDVALGHRPLSPSETALLRAAWPDPGRSG
ncbi:hypothetical protein OG455_37290 [Kitasatospora sp. NBC_01287]|uniref:hypothetical protein n=1 Tax=Kitasatospora sp. NBC_01287 TaxID=2903573 RepID=UPI002259E97D|nr:hypothetical protein [Kitasatospora sp. NBC_01287]MCX4751096.1 hypothetical protein [Kitasatospora sp. NBC_01287]